MVNPTRKRKRKITAIDDNSIIDETSFQSTVTSDFTIHFNNHAFHVHSVVLQNASTFFDAAIQAAIADDTVCDRTQLCVQPNHRCIVIGEAGGDQIGGTLTTTNEIHRLISQMYDPAWFCQTFSKPESQLVQWRAGLASGGRVLYDRAGGDDSEENRSPEWFIADIRGADNTMLVLSYLIVDDSDDVNQTVDENGLSEEEIHVSRDSGQLMPLGTSEMRIITDDLQRFLDQHSRTIMLANYFCCMSMMNLYRMRSHQLAINAADMHHYHPLWKLLVISETCHWQDIVDICLKALSNDLGCTKRTDWSTTAERISSKSLVKILGTLVSTNV